MTYEHQPYHSPEQPAQQTPPQQPRKRRRWPWVVGAVVALGVIGNLLPDTGDDEPAGTRGIAEGTVQVTTEPEPTTTEPEPEPTTEPEPEPEVDEVGTGTLTDYDLTMLALAATWEEMDEDEQESICWGVDVFGVDFAADEIHDGSDGMLDREAIVDFLELACADEA